MIEIYNEKPTRIQGCPLFNYVINGDIIDGCNDPRFIDVTAWGDLMKYVRNYLIPDCFYIGLFQLPIFNNMMPEFHTIAICRGMNNGQTIFLGVLDYPLELIPRRGC